MRERELRLDQLTYIMKGVLEQERKRKEPFWLVRMRRREDYFIGCRVFWLTAIPPNADILAMAEQVRDEKGGE